MTTELEKAARQALEALEKALRYHGVMLLSDPPQDAWKYHRVEQTAHEAITALSRALEEQSSVEQPAQDEPVAIADGTFNHNCPIGVPLYTRPQAREPKQPARDEPVGEVIDERGEVDWISFVPPAGTFLYTRQCNCKECPCNKQN